MLFNQFKDREELNRHRNPIFDSIFGIKNTTSWRNTWKEIRDDGKTKLFAEVDALPDNHANRKNSNRHNLMTKTKTIYTCQQCAAQFPKWAGQCGDCGQWNTIIEEIAQSPSRVTQYAGAQAATVQYFSQIHFEQDLRFSTGFKEFDRVLGGGLVAGSVVLLGGDPGIGKSTILLQTLCVLGKEQKALYITGEESLQQVTARASRLGIHADCLGLVTETQVEKILHLMTEFKPKVVIIDSIQTMFSEQINGAPGSVSQVRESAAQLVRFAKQTQTALFLVGHVTKEGQLAGPRILEHMVDTVLYFEGETDSRYRMIRAIKNRFGAINELGVFAMTDTGLREVTNPSAIFLANHLPSTPGSAILVAWEGTRPLLVEVQALVDESHLANPRRVAIGFDQNRLALLLAVLHRHANIPTYQKDVFVNIVGGLKVNETAADLAILLAIFSSLRNHPLPQKLVVFGEVGLGGEIRPVQSGSERVKEAAKHGFTQAIVPVANAPKKDFADLSTIKVQHLHEVLKTLS